MTGGMPRVFAAVVALFFLMTLYRTITGLWSNADGLQVWVQRFSPTQGLIFNHSP